MSDIVKKIRLTTFKETPMPTPFTIPQELLRASLKDTKKSCVKSDTAVFTLMINR